MARLKSLGAHGGSRLAVLTLVLVLVGTAAGLLALGGFASVTASVAAATATSASSATAVNCPTCPACDKANGSVPAQADRPLPEPPQDAPEEPGDEAKVAAAARGADPAAAAAHPSGVPLLCGGPGAVPLVADALAASTEALYPNAAAAFRPWDKGFTQEDLEATAEYMGADKLRADIHMVVEVRDKQLIFPRQQDVCPGCNQAVFHVKKGVDKGLAAGVLRIPEGVPLLLNVMDQSGGASSCAAPVFSIFKDYRDLDVLMPHFKPAGLDPHFVPWEQKQPKAFFRREEEARRPGTPPRPSGSPICSWVPLNGTAVAASKNCSRWAIAQLSWDHPDLLNITLTENVTQYGGPMFVPGPHVSHEEQAWYRYLVSADGSTAAWRLATVLMKNSLVIKQASPRVEYYYHAIHPCVHYMHYWVTSETDLVDIVRALNASPQNQLTAQRISANGQAFAAAHLTEEAQWKYWQALIDRYLQLFRGPIGGAGNGTVAGAPGGGEAAATGAAEASGKGEEEQQPEAEQPAEGEEQQPEAKKAAEGEQQQAEEKQPAEGEEQQPEAEQPAEGGEQREPEQPAQDGEKEQAQQEGEQQEGEGGTPKEEQQAAENKPARRLRRLLLSHQQRLHD
ncbi:hypothetical protein CHLNCDRAFT_133347 [Chlorella variabilis]|uniref:Glycosyl transferase CAP10 domain-containing protein n=1 Tax=Chlorella variabilis TaxID=554065 RepID=E1Z2W9_CHLVA|nr:hypothetical protein CHLNCDRAFT_133347 [Chlorella variabilis]EFN59741.1 hypothetical protein CHLNCDRAFT_133347 [Chlorella variabilis]|eukprot:XP_005851843.1 hypothetical protein CHLNCDRAFT_133347 [Chlorella variabilis]